MPLSRSSYCWFDVAILWTELCGCRVDLRVGLKLIWQLFGFRSSIRDQSRQVRPKPHLLGWLCMTSLSSWNLLILKLWVTNFFPTIVNFRNWFQLQLCCFNAWDFPAANYVILTSSLSTSARKGFRGAVGCPSSACFDSMLHCLELRNRSWWDDEVPDAVESGKVLRTPTLTAAVEVRVLQVWSS